MLNKEKYKDELEEILDNEIAVTINGEVCECSELNECKKCIFCGKDCPEAAFEWLNSECREPILDEEEKAYLKLVIKNCRDNVRYISKKLDDYWSEEYICISIDGTSEAVSPRFIENTQFKKMVCDRKYTLEELGL